MENGCVFSHSLVESFERNTNRWKRNGWEHFCGHDDPCFINLVVIATVDCVNVEIHSDVNSCFRASFQTYQVCDTKNAGFKWSTHLISKHD